MAWVAVSESRIRSKIELESVVVGNTVVYTAAYITVGGGGGFFHVDYAELEPGETVQLRVVLSGASSDAIPAGVNGLAEYVDPVEGQTLFDLGPWTNADFTYDFTLTLLDPDYDNQGEFVLRLDGGGGANLDNFSGTFTLYEQYAEPEPEPSSCFWDHDSMAGVTEDCDA